MATDCLFHVFQYSGSSHLKGLLCLLLMLSVIKKTFNQVNSSLHGQNDHYFTDDIFRCISMNENFFILIKISLKFVPTSPTGINPALV